MKKLIKKSFAFALLAALPISYTTNLHARHGGGWGWGGFATGLVAGGLIGAAASRGGGGGYSGYNLDYMNLPYWEVKNNASFPILVRASGNKNFTQIMPGEIVNISRERKFKLYAKDYNDGRKRPNKIETRNHYVEIRATESGQIEFHTPAPTPSPPPPPQSAPGGYYSNGYY